jgi:hypothetical protein
MLLRKFTIGAVNYFCNELQIKEAGGLEAAAKKMAGIKPKEEKKPEGEKPIEK